MKKLTAVILAAFMLFEFCSCRQSREQGFENSSVLSEVSDVSEPEQESEAEQSEETTSVPEAFDEVSKLEKNADPEPNYEPITLPVDERTPAEKYVDGLTLEQQLGQMFFARCPESGAAEQAARFNVGGFILFGRDFEGQTPESLRQKISEYQSAAKTPLLIGTDEEGGSVVRVSAYKAFRSEKFHSPGYLYSRGGIDAVIADADEKDALLKGLGINVNLAPVCDVSENPSDFIYSRTLGKGAEETAEYISRLVEKMNFDGVGSVLKHFPGYGGNSDTHTEIAVDEREKEEFYQKDFLPFFAGISAGAGGVLVSHNIVKSFDSNLPASLSPEIHRVLREELGFEGVIMTDDLAMKAITAYTGDKSAAVLAVEAGNDMIISSDLESQYTAVLDAVNGGTISRERIRQSAVRVLNWKITLGLVEI